VLVNEIDSAKIKDLKKRSKGSVFVLATYFIVFFLALFFSQDQSYPWTITVQGRLIIFFIICAILAGIFLIANKEITNLFSKSMISVLKTYSLFFVSCAFSTIVVVVQRFSNTGYLIVKNFDVHIAVSLLAFLSIFFYLLIWDKTLTKKNKMLLTLTFFLTNLSYLAIIYSISSSNWSWAYFLTISAIPITSDSFAYFSGLRFGKHKMSPKISPKKTWEGFFGGFFSCTIMIMIFQFLTFQFYNQDAIIDFYKINVDKFDVNYVFLLAFFIIAISSVTSTIGDLYYSLVKRSFKVKDYSNLIPGHGGILDRIDSLCFVAIFYLVYSLILSV
jgi:phosphatidate cytidylyltransferase